MADVGVVINGYRLRSLLQTGQVSQVFEVVEVKSNRHFAMKLLLPEAAEKAEHRRTLFNEAEVGEKMTHANVIRIVRVSRAKDTPHFIMEFFPSGGLRLRYFGARPLIEDNSVRSPSSTLVNAKLGYALAKDIKLTVDVMNLFNRQVSDIDYLYESRLPGEAAPVTDIHTHPAEPRAVRVGMAIRF